jgi:hypothetical protein
MWSPFFAVIEEKNLNKDLTMLWALIIIIFMHLGIADDFIIEAGDHYAQEKKVSLFRGESLEFNAYFNESAQYDLKYEDQYDVNKLMG